MMANQPSIDEDLARVVDRPNMDRAAAILDEQIAAQEAAERRRVFTAIRSGALDPQQAVQAWMALETLDSLRSRLSKEIRMAQSAGRRAGPHMSDSI